MQVALVIESVGVATVLCDIYASRDDVITLSREVSYASLWIGTQETGLAVDIASEHEWAHSLAPASSVVQLAERISQPACAVVLALMLAWDAFVLVAVRAIAQRLTLTTRLLGLLCHSVSVVISGDELMTFQQISVDVMTAHLWFHSHCIACE